jgi:hypothetical protein
MTTHVDEATTEVEVEPTPAAGEDSGPAELWQELARTRALDARLRRDRARTSSRGFDD